MESRQATEDDDVYHFIGYVHTGGKLYELDGLKEGPIELATCSEDEWLSKAGPAIQERMAQYAQKEIRFNLLAVIQNREFLYSQKLSKLTKLKEAIQSKLELGDASMDTTDEKLPSDPAELKTRLSLATEESSQLETLIQQEKDKFKKWKVL